MDGRACRWLTGASIDSVLSTQYSALSTQYSALSTLYSALCTLHSALPWLDSRMDRSHYPTRKLRLGDADDARDLESLSPSARVALVWPMTLQAWAFFEGLDHEPRLRRDVVRLSRREG